jgi:hypothetical protein
MTLGRKQRKRVREQYGEVRKRGPAQRKIGRPIQPGEQLADKFNKTDVDALVHDVAMGVPLGVACGSAGISVRTFQSWLDRRPEFAQKLCAEKRRVIVEMLTAIRDCRTKDSEFRNLAWLLERCYPEAFAPKPPNVAVGVQQNFTITVEQAQGIEEMRAKLVPRVNERFLTLANGEGTNGTETAS